MLIEKTIASGDKAYVFVSAVVDPPGKVNKNILTAEQKIPLLTNMFEKEVEDGKVVFIHTKKDCLPEYPNCGGPFASFKWLMERFKYTPDDITLVIGKERLDPDKPKEYFGPDPKSTKWGVVRPANFVSVGKTAERNMKPEDLSAENMSGTKARRYAWNGNKASFYTALGYVYDPAKTDRNVEDVYEAIRKVPDPRGVKNGGGEEVAIGPDNLEEGLIAEEEVVTVSGGTKRRKTRRIKKSSRLLERLEHLVNSTR
jgi:hypothetical protein